MKFIAHRGYSKLELENTKEAFLAAANRSFYGIETDVTKTKDNYYVLFHDEELSRLANDDRKLIDLTLKQLSKIALNKRGTYHTEEYHICTLEEYLKICKHYRKHPIIELKWAITQDDVDKIMAMILDEGLYEDSTIICFTFSIILYLRKKYPDYDIQFLLGMLYSVELINKCLDLGINIDLRYDLITKELVDQFHEKKLEVNAWTVDDIEIAKKMNDLGVDYLTSNILEEI